MAQRHTFFRRSCSLEAESSAVAETQLAQKVPAVATWKSPTGSKPGVAQAAGKTAAGKAAPAAKAGAASRAGAATAADAATPLPAGLRKQVGCP